MKLSATYTTSQTIYATLLRLSDGYFWNQAASAWQAAPTLANQKITLTENGAGYLGNYDSANLTALGDAGNVRVYYHGSDDKVLGSAGTFVQASEEPTLIAQVQTSLTAQGLTTTRAASLENLDAPVSGVSVDLSGLATLEDLNDRTLSSGSYALKSLQNDLVDRFDASEIETLRADLPVLTRDAIKADAEWKTMLANANGVFDYNPTTGLLILKDKTGIATLATLTLTRDADGVVTHRASA